MNRFRTGAKPANLFFVALFYFVSSSFAFANGITGTYTGSYSGGSSQTGNSDSGTITITIDPYGNVSCDFYSTVYGTDNIAAGSANVDPTVSSPPYNSSTIACVNSGAGANFTPAGPPPSGYHPFFSGIINLTWNSTSGQIIFSPIGTWFNSSGYGGNFLLNVPATPNATTARINAEGLSGMWFDPQYTGSGFNLIGSSAGLIVTYYGWDKSGNRLWLVSGPLTNSIALGQSLTFDLSQTVDGTFSTPAPPSTIAAWGTLTLTFTSCTTATATLSGTDGSVNESLSLLAGLSGLGCQ